MVYLIILFINILTIVYYSTDTMVWWEGAHVHVYHSLLCARVCARVCAPVCVCNRIDYAMLSKTSALQTIRSAGLQRGVSIFISFIFTRFLDYSISNKKSSQIRRTLLFQRRGTGGGRYVQLPSRTGVRAHACVRGI